MTQINSSSWWERERQRFLKRVLIGLLLVLALIGYFTYVNSQGRIGIVRGVSFDTNNYIAFVRNADDGSATIYAVRADGTDLRKLTTDPSNKEHPCWTPDGKSLVFSSNLKDARSTQLYILGDGAPRQLTYGSGNKFSPVVSPSGKLVAFITQGAIKTVTITGTDVTQVLPQPRSGNEGEGTAAGIPDEELGPYLSAAFAPDGITLAGIQDVSNAVIEARSEDTRDDPSSFHALPIDQQVIVLPGNGSRPYPPMAQGHEVSMAWEPNGARLACSYTELPMVDEHGRYVDLDRKPLAKGKKPLPISGIQVWSFPPSSKPTFIPVFACLGYSVEAKNICWSPDGARIAFELWRLKDEGVRELMGVEALDIVEQMPDGSTKLKGLQIRPEQVSQLPVLVPAGPQGRPQQPRWSPDGRRLVYEMARPNGKRDLWIINADGTSPINLTKGEGDNSDAAWAPNSIAAK